MELFNMQNHQEPTLEEMQLFEAALEEENETDTDQLADAELEMKEYEEDFAPDYGDGKQDSYVVDSTKQYLNEIGRYPLLTAEQERELSTRMRQGGQEGFEARQLLINSNLRLVAHYAKKYLGRGVDFDDLNMIGVDGLITAVDKFEPEKNCKFSTYAHWWIMQSITRGIAEESGMIRIPVHMTEAIYKVRKAKAKLSQENKEVPTLEELAVETGLPKDKVKLAIESMFSTIHFGTQIGDDGDSTLEDLLPDDRALDPCEEAVKKSLKAVIAGVLDKLDPKEAMVLRYRFGIGVERPMTLEEIGSLPEFGVTRERVRQIENKAICKIKKNVGMRSQLLDFAS